MGRPNRRGPGSQTRHQTFTPPTAPELFFRGDQAEPDEVAAFRNALDDKPEEVKKALDAWRPGQAVEASDEDVVGSVVHNIITSQHWSGQPSGLAVDRTTQDIYVTENRPAFAHIGAMEATDPRYAAAQQELRVAMLTTLASRAIDASMGVVYRAA